MTQIDFKSLKTAIHNILKQEYSEWHNANNSISAFVMNVIDENEAAIKALEPQYIKMIVFIQKLIEKQVNDMLAKHKNSSNKAWIKEIEFIVDIIDFEGMTSKHDAYDAYDDEEKDFNLNIADIPTTLSDLEFISSSLNILSFAKPIVITQLFGALYTQTESDYNNVNDLDSILNDSIDEMMNEFKKKTSERGITFHSNIIDNNLWSYSQLEISLLFDIYCIYWIHNEYLLDRKTTYDTRRFREHCIDSTNNILTEETTVFQKAIDYFDQHIIHSIDIKNRFSFIIDDDIVIYIHFLFGFSDYLRSLSLNLNTNLCPLQFDVIFIPRNIKDLIKNANAPHNVNFNSSDFAAFDHVESWFGSDDNFQTKDAIQVICEKFKQLIDELHKKSNSYSMKCCRYVVIINRSALKNEIYLYRVRNDIVDNDAFMLHRTKHISYYKHLFIVSFHLHSNTKRRVYWHFNNECIRFFPSMIHSLWIKYFIIKKSKTWDYIHSFAIKNGFKFKLSDTLFEQYYREITGCFNLNNLNYKRDKKQLKILNHASYSTQNTINILHTTLKELNQTQFCKIFMYTIVKVCGMKHVNIERCENIVAQLGLNGAQLLQMNKNLLKKSLINANIQSISAFMVIKQLFKLSAFDISHILNKPLKDIEDEDDDEEWKAATDEELDSNLQSLCAYLKKYQNIEEIKDINQSLIIQIMDHWITLCQSCTNTSNNKYKNPSKRIIDVYDSLNLAPGYKKLRAYNSNADNNYNAYLLILIYRWFEEIFNNAQAMKPPTYRINIEHEWFYSYQRPIYDDLESEICGNFGLDSKEMKQYRDIKYYCEILSQSKWNKSLRLCLNEMIAIKFYIECKKVRALIKNVFSSKSSILERRKYFHLSFEIKKALIYDGVKTKSNHLFENAYNEIVLKVEMIAPFGSTFRSHLILVSNDDDDKYDEQNINVKLKDLIGFLANKSTALKSKSEYYVAVGINKKLANELNSNRYICALSKNPLLFQRSTLKKDRKWLEKWGNEKKDWISNVCDYVKSIKKNAYEKDMHANDDDDDDEVNICNNVLSLMRGISIAEINDDEDGAILQSMKQLMKDTYNNSVLYKQYIKKELLESRETFDSVKLTYSVFERLLTEFEFYYLPFARFVKIRYSGKPNKDYSKLSVSNPEKAKKKLAKARMKLNNLFKYRRSAIIYYQQDGIHLLYDIISKLENKFNLQHCGITIDYRLMYRFVAHYDKKYSKKVEEEEKEKEWNDIKFSTKHKSESFLSQLQQTSHIANYLFERLKGFIFDRHLKYNKFEYKLFCSIKQLHAAAKWIEIDNGHFDVYMDCVINGETYEITDYPSTNNDIFKFQNLVIENGGKLTVKPFGNLSPFGYLMGYIRIHCYDNIRIDEDCELFVNGRGYYMAVDEVLGSGRSFSAKNKKKKKKSKKKKKKEYNYGESAVINYFSGGGYGSKGGDCIKEDGEIVCFGGSIYGEKRLQTLYFGSCGGKGGKLQESRTDRGGGIIEIIVGNELNNCGSISSNGRRGQTGGGKYSGGSGGSIKIVCHKLCNDGVIQAIGGRGFQQHGDGGNGRIAIYTNYTNKGGKDMCEPSANSFFDVKENAPRKSTIFNNKPILNANANANETFNNKKKKEKNESKSSKLKRLFRFK